MTICSRTIGQDWSIFSGILLLLQSLPITKKMSIKRANTLVF